MDRDPNIVIIGGGTGLSYVLKGIKKYPIDITAIVTVGDDGGSSGDIRNSINVVPPGDIRKVMVAMSETEPLMNNLLNHRFNDDNIFANHTVGNILLTALFQITGDYVQAIRKLCNVLNVKGTILPVAQKPITLSAVMDDDSVIIGESHITAAKKRIKEISIVEKDIEVTKEVLDAINEADMIVFGPGSIFTSIIPNLLVPGVKEAINQSKAKKVYVCNIMTEPGESDHFTVSKHVSILEKYLGNSIIDSIIANDDKNIDNEILSKYKEKDADLVEIDYEEIIKMNKELITGNFIYVNENNHLRHNSKKIAAYLMMMLIDTIE
ncbi:MAG TPA: uridine diphosphate-N-acetylglucosamine-binding protein YvcK [Haloplasmataceae bacterium]